MKPSEFERVVADLVSAEHSVRLKALHMKVRDIKAAAAKSGSFGGSRMAIQIVSACAETARFGVADAFQAIEKAVLSIRPDIEGRLEEYLGGVFLSQVAQWRRAVMSAKTSFLSGGSGGYPSYANADASSLDQAFAEATTSALAHLTLVCKQHSGNAVNLVSAFQAALFSRRAIALLAIVLLFLAWLLGLFADVKEMLG